MAPFQNNHKTLNQLPLGITKHKLLKNQMRFGSLNNCFVLFFDPANREPFSLFKFASARAHDTFQHCWGYLRLLQEVSGVFQGVSSAF